MKSHHYSCVINQSTVGKNFIVYDSTNYLFQEFMNRGGCTIFCNFLVANLHYLDLCSSLVRPKLRNKRFYPRTSVGNTFSLEAQYRPCWGIGVAQEASGSHLDWPESLQFFSPSDIIKQSFILEDTRNLNWNFARLFIQIHRLKNVIISQISEFRTTIVTDKFLLSVLLSADWYLWLQNFLLHALSSHMHMERHIWNTCKNDHRISLASWISSSR